MKIKALILLLFITASSVAQRSFSEDVFVEGEGIIAKVVVFARTYDKCAKHITIINKTREFRAFRLEIYNSANERVYSSWVSMSPESSKTRYNAVTECLKGMSVVTSNHTK